MQQFDVGLGLSKPYMYMDVFVLIVDENVHILLLDALLIV